MTFSTARKNENKRIAEQHGCILTGKTEGIDPAHWPLRRSQGAGWGLLEFVPLASRFHRALDQEAPDPALIALVDGAARLYYRRMLRFYPDCYLGPPERIEEVRNGGS